MYSTCLFCNRPLGSNERIEQLPIGRRIAFDPGKGRLWVVCASCARWNLTPLEERWEAVEECERTFRGARLRASSPNIGLAHLRDDFELIRIGQPLRPEFAAWRYGSRFVHRWRASRFAPTPAVLGISEGAAVATAVGIAVSFAVNPLLGALAGSAAGFSTGFAGWFAHLKHRGQRRLTWAPTDRGFPEPITGGDAYRTWLVHKPEKSWSLSILSSGATRREYDGAIARRILGSLMTEVNWRGATQNTTDVALRLIEDAPGGEDPVGSLAMHLSTERKTAALFYLDAPLQLALEMAVHESLERPAVEGHLLELEQAWREAEEIAAIADDMFLPPAITEHLSRLRGGPVG